ncbi:MAG: GNAT family N-acetyltransferase [Bacteroidota bacterium]
MINYDEINTKRLILRRLDENDAGTVFRIFSDPETIKFVNTGQHESLDDSKKLIKYYLDQSENKQGFMWSIDFKEQRKMIGIIGLLHINHDHAYCSFGSLLLREFWNQSYNTEAHIALINFAFTKTKLNRIESQFFENHKAVERMLIKSGMKNEGILRENFLLHGKFVNSKLYSIIKSDFLNNRDFYSFSG